MGHNHDHHHSTRNIRTAFFLNLAFTIFEIIGGLYVNSVAIVSDAVHDLGDSLALGTSWFLQNKSIKGASKDFSYGYKRLSLLAALINSIVLISGSVFVISEAIDRLVQPESSDAVGMMIFALVGIAVNGYAAWKMSSGKTLNERLVTWHLIEDVLGWVAILIVALVLQFKDIQYLDPALSLLITVYILWNVVKRLKETLFLFLQGHPKDVDSDLLEKNLLDVDKIESIHHMHIWSLDGERHVFSAHFVVSDNVSIEQYSEIKKQLKEVLEKFPFDHYTLEIELAHEPCGLENSANEDH